jgi:predicted CXXCH cytochrome family protein
MKKLIKLSLVLTVVLPLAAMAQITGTRHDLATGAAGGGPKATTQNQTCVFCHTPHKALAQALIWNHNLPAGTRGWSAGTQTAEGTPLPAAINADSMRCLSCHDGTVGLGDVNNMGGGTAGTIVMSGPVTAGYLVGNGAAGNEMVNNHPVSIPYAGLTVGTVTSKAVADGTVGNYWQVASGASCSSPSGFCTAKAATGSFINLKGTVATALTVECSSCHEPHNKYGGTYFLRVAAANSALCLACHNK